MKCPFCEEEMRAGWVRSSHIVTWSQTEHTLFAGSIFDDVCLTKWGRRNLFSHYCEKCKKIIMDVEE